jgi:hypothetical protein
LDLLHASPEVLGKGAFRMGSGVGLEESWSSAAIGVVHNIFYWLSSLSLWRAHEGTGLLGGAGFCFVLIFTLFSHLYECV